MDDREYLDQLTQTLEFLRGILDSPEERTWCRDFGKDVPQAFQEKIGGFLLNCRESGLLDVFRSDPESASQEGTILVYPPSEDLKAMSDAQLRSQVASLMDTDSPFVLYGMSSGLLYNLFSELLLRKEKELANGKVCRLSEKDLDDVQAFGETLFPGGGKAMRLTLSRQMEDDRAALFFFRRMFEPVGLAHCRIRSDYVEGASSSDAGVAYLEGLYLKAEASPDASLQLIEAVSDWAREKGCRELASDCALGDDKGAAVRAMAGFAEAAKIVCFIKEL